VLTKAIIFLFQTVLMPAPTISLRQPQASVAVEMQKLNPATAMETAATVVAMEVQVIPQTSQMWITPN